MLVNACFSIVTIVLAKLMTFVNIFLNGQIEIHNAKFSKGALSLIFHSFKP